MKNILTRNIGLKIVSLILAVVLWIFINGMIDPVTTVTIKDVPVSILNEDAMQSSNKIYEVISGDKIDIKVRAKESIANKLTINDFKATADFLYNSYFGDVNNVMIDVSCITYTENEVEIVDGMNEIMNLSLEDTDSQSYAVSVVADGTVADGYYIAETAASPNLITISGTKTQISKIAKLKVLVDVEGASDSFDVKGTPVLYDSEDNVVDASKLTLSSEQVDVSVRLLPTKEIDLKVVPEGDAYYNYVCTGIEYAPQTIVIAGEEEDLAAISYLQLVCVISGAKADIETDLSIEDALTELYGSKYIIVDKDTTTAKVKATIEKLDTTDISMLASNIEARNVQDGLRVSYLTLTTVLKVYGLASDLEDVSSATVKPYIDCSECTSPGTYTLPVMTEQNGLEIRSSAIEITIYQDNISNTGPGINQP